MGKCHWNGGAGPSSLKGKRGFGNLISTRFLASLGCENRSQTEQRGKQTNPMLGIIRSRYIDQLGQRNTSRNSDRAEISPFVEQAWRLLQGQQRNQSKFPARDKRSRFCRLFAVSLGNMLSSHALHRLDSQRRGRRHWSRKIKRPLMCSPCAVHRSTTVLASDTSSWFTQSLSCFPQQEQTQHPAPRRSPLRTL